jgi:hypothetical protein
VVIGLAALLLAGSSASAQEPSSTPSPKALWDAYPLDPDKIPATATPSAEFGASPSATPARPASSDDDGMPWLVVVLLAAPLVFAAGLLIGHRRNRAPSAQPAGAGESPAPRRFQWRDYPEPPRPAPPPPPVPGARAPFEVALDQQRAARTARPKEREPH